MGLMLLVMFFWFICMVVMASQLFVLALRQRRRPDTAGMLVDARGRKLGSEQHRTLHLPLPYHDAFSLCHESLRALPGARLTRMSRDEQRIHARHRMSWRSMGEVIEFRLEPLGKKDTFVHISSRCWFPTELVDYGKNEDNANALVGFLMSRTGRMLPPPTHRALPS